MYDEATLPAPVETVPFRAVAVRSPRPRTLVGRRSARLNDAVATEQQVHPITVCGCRVQRLATPFGGDFFT